MSLIGRVHDGAPAAFLSRGTAAFSLLVVAVGYADVEADGVHAIAVGVVGAVPVVQRLLGVLLVIEDAVAVGPVVGLVAQVVHGEVSGALGGGGDGVDGAADPVGVTDRHGRCPHFSSLRSASSRSRRAR